MASGSTSIWKRPYPLATDSPTVHTDIEALANSLESVPLYPITASTSAFILAGTRVIASPSITLTLPSAPNQGDVLEVVAGQLVTGSTPVTVSAAGGKVINGVGLSGASSFTLGTPYGRAMLQYDGTDWLVIGGRPGGSGATNISASQSTSSTSFTVLSTPDEVTGIVLPTNGLIRVWYQAMWQTSVAGAGQAAIFLGSNQVSIQGWDGTTGHEPLVQSAWGTTAATNEPLFSYFGGLGSGQSGTAYSADVTTGQIVGFANEDGGSIGTQLGVAQTSFGYPSSGVGSQSAITGGACDIFAAAGTYTVSVKFKASSGTVTASNRKLWVEVIPFG